MALRHKWCLSPVSSRLEDIFVAAADRKISRKRKLPLLALLLFAASTFGSIARGQTPREEVRRIDRQARTAYESKDYPGFLRASRRLVELAPRSTRALYNLACAMALSGLPDEALSQLERLARMGVYFDVASDDDLASLRGDSRFGTVRARMKALEQPIVRATELVRLTENDLLTEGVAYDRKTGAFFVSSVHRRKIVRISSSGQVSDFVPEGSDGLLSAGALALDPERRSLFVSSAGTTYARGITDERRGASEVLEYGLDDARLRRRILPPSAPPGAAVSDLALDAEGVLYAADPAGGGVYIASPKQRSFRVLVPSGSMGSAQGMTLTPDGSTLFVSDYTSGIWHIAPHTGEARVMEAPEDAALTGIDGLVYYQGSLLGIRNGFRPHAIVRLRLSAGLDRVDEALVLERADPRWDEPTLGILAGDSLVYVARSQYRRFSKDGVPGPNLEAPILLKLALDW